MPLQLTTVGLEIKTEAEIRESLVARLRARFGNGVRTKAGSVFGDFIDIFTAEILSLNEALLNVYNSFDRRFAEGDSLDSLGLLVGVEREPASKSTAPGLATGAPGTVITAGSQVRIPGSTFWIVRDDATIPGGGSVAVTLQAVDFGPVEAASGTITQIVDSIPGWTDITNTATASVGRDVEEDGSYRLSLRNELLSGPQSTDQAIRKAIAALEDVISVTVRSNRFDSPVDSEGLPINRFRAVVYPSTADGDQVALAIWSRQPSGMGSFGSQSAIVVDETGHDQLVFWDWAADVPMYVGIELKVNPLTFPANGVDLVKAAIESYGSDLLVGEDIYPSRIQCDVLEVAGVLNTKIKVGSAPAPTNEDPVEVDYDQIATFDAANVTVTIP